jgi:putative membrane protein
VWLSLLPILLSAAALLFIPGVLVGASAGLRTPLIIGLAPAISIAIISGTGVAAPILALPWGLASVATATAIACLAALATRRLMARRHSQDADSGDAGLHPRLRSIAVWCAAWPLSAAATGLTIARILNTPDAISQTFDAVFHLNAVEWILQTNNASSLRLFLEAPQGSVYPLGWHTLVALAMKLCGATSIPMATNATVLAVAGLVWTSGCLTLTHVLFHGRPAALLTAAVMAGSFTVFPFVLLNWGVLYPNFLSIALLPSLLAAVRTLVPIDGAGPAPRPTGLLLPATALGVAGLGLTQPNTIATLLLASVILTTARLITSLRAPLDERPTHMLRRQSLITGALAVGLVMVWMYMRPPRESAIWGPSYATSGSVGEAVTSMPVQLPVIWVPAVLTLLGFIAALRTDKYRWLAVLHATTGALYVIARSAQDGDLRFFMVGIWYNDASRLGGLIPVTAVPLAALGMLAAAQWGREACGACGRVIRGITASREHQTHGLPGQRRVRGACERLISIGRARPLVWKGGASSVIVALLVATGPLSGAMSDSVKILEQSYMLAPDSSSLTTDEYALINELPSLIEPDAVIAVDPKSGAALAYALSGADTTVKHLFHRHDADLDIIEKKLNRASADPAVCTALKDVGATYALYFPGKTISNQKAFVGFAHLDTAPGFELVAERGQASLYRITACG